MPETLEDIERKIAELEKKIKAIEDIPEGQRTERQEARLDTFYQERVLLRGDKKRLIEGTGPGKLSHLVIAVLLSDLQCCWCSI
jgi:protein-disulfide isomerase